MILLISKKAKAFINMDKGPPSNKEIVLERVAIATGESSDKAEDMQRMLIAQVPYYFDKVTR